MSSVMIVEDETRFRTDLVDFLSLCGFNAMGVGSIAEYHRRSQPAEEVIVDVGLPTAAALILFGIFAAPPRQE